MLAFFQLSPPEVIWNIGLDEFEELLASKRGSTLGLDFFIFLKNSTALLAVLGPSFSSPLTRLSLLALAQAERCSSQSLMRLTPKVSSSVRLKHYYLLQHANVIVKMIDAAMCSSLRRYSIECVHPLQRCVTLRITTDNIF